jgi:hypothetical protein
VIGEFSCHSWGTLLPDKDKARCERFIRSGVEAYDTYRDLAGKRLCEKRSFAFKQSKENRLYMPKHLSFSSSRGEEMAPDGHGTEQYELALLAFSHSL